MIFRTPAFRPVKSSLGVFVLILGCAAALRAQQVQSTSSSIQLLMQRAQQAASAGKAEQAAGFYREVLRIKPRWPPAEFDLALACHFQKNYAAAIDLFTDVLLQNPSIVSAYLFRGLDYYETNQYEKAIASLKKALELKSADSQAYFYLGASYYQLGDYRHAALAYVEHVRLSPKTEDTYFQLIQCYEALRDAASQRLNADPHAAYFVLLLEAASGAPRHDNPVGDEDLQLAIKSHPDFPEAWLLLGERATRAGDLVNARNYFGQAEQASLHVAPTLRGIVGTVRNSGSGCDQAGNLALPLCRAKQSDLRSATRLLVSSTVPTEGARDLYWTAQTYTALIQSASAKLAALSPDSPQLRRLYARAYAREGQREEAAQEYEKAIASDDQDASALIEYANFRSIAQEFPQAIDLLRKALALTPEDDKLRLLLGEAYVHNNEPALAIPYLYRSLKANPGGEQQRLELAQVLHTVDRVSEAIAILEAAPSDPDGRISYVLSRYYALQGRKDKAKQAMDIFKKHKQNSAMPE
jgi:tetratricopeptide (TPR) repeat protein